jgi:protein-S-isoprenylcysteine O-methyltransferase Ste14
MFMKDKLLEQTKHEYRPKQRSIALSIEAVFFLVIFPFVLIELGASFDRWSQWSVALAEPVHFLLGAMFAIAGWLFAIWAIYVQFTLGRGTPVPLMATQKLIVQPPYTYCRNPMALGAIVMYLGVAVLFGSPGAAVLVLLGAIVLLTYIKRIEEQEMELRFGQEYLAYKRRTPFLIPRLPKNR